MVPTLTLICHSFWMFFRYRDIYMVYIYIWYILIFGITNLLPFYVHFGINYISHFIQHLYGCFFFSRQVLEFFLGVHDSMLSCFSDFLPFCFSAFMLLCFSASLFLCFLFSLLLCFSCFSAFCFSCFFAFPASLFFCFSVFPASLLPCFLFLLSLCFSFSFAWFYSVCIPTETLETP